MTYTEVQRQAEQAWQDYYRAVDYLLAAGKHDELEERARECERLDALAAELWEERYATV